MLPEGTPVARSISPESKDWVKSALNALSKGEALNRTPKWYRELRRLIVEDVRPDDQIYDFMGCSKDADSPTIRMTSLWAGIQLRFFWADCTPIASRIALWNAAASILANGDWTTVSKILSDYVPKEDDKAENAVEDLEPHLSDPPVEASAANADVKDRASAVLHFGKSQFQEALGRALRLIENGPWWKLFVDKANTDNKLAQLGERIHELQMRKMEGQAPVRNNRLTGDEGFVIESTHEVLLSACETFPEIPLAFDSFVDALSVVDGVEGFFVEQNLVFLRNDWVRELGERIPRPRLYLFLLYFVHLAVEAPLALRTRRSQELLSRNHIFSLLQGHAVGINSDFITFLGTDLFCREGENFHKRYWHKYIIQPGDSIQKIIHKNYPTSDIDFEMCLQGLLEWHDFLRGIDITIDLYPILEPLGKLTITVVPPGPKDNAYRAGSAEVGRWIKERNRRKPDDGDRR